MLHRVDGSTVMSNPPNGDIPMIRIALALGLLLLLSPVQAAASLEAFLGDLNVEARADLPGFSARVSTQFGVPVARVQAVIQAVETPADAFMVFQLGQMAHRQPEAVLQTYKAGKGKGWGAMAKELGIKPGSKEFKALKSGDLVLHHTGAHAAADGHKSKGKKKK
jgi:hypothetical protein